MKTHAAADRTAPLTDDALLQERIAFLLRRASLRQLWMMFLFADDVQSEILIPCADLPVTPHEILTTDDHERSHADVLGERVAEIMEGLGFAQAVFVWERPGEPAAGVEEREWARALAEACAQHGARVRAQFLLHDQGVRALAPDDYLSKE